MDIVIFHRYILCFLLDDSFKLQEMLCLTEHGTTSSIKWSRSIFSILQVVYYFDSFCHFVVVISVISVWSQGSFRFYRFGGFAWLVSFFSLRSFHFARFACSTSVVSFSCFGIYTCKLEGCIVVWVKFLTRPSIALSSHGETIAYIIPIVALFRGGNIEVICLCFILL